MDQLESPVIEDLTRFAMDVLHRAGTEALHYYGKGDPLVKFDSDLVTEAELHLNDFFRNELHSQFPEHGIFGDELPKQDYLHGERRYLWIYDALDGVANFQAGIPIWGTSLALLENFWPIFGVFYMPVTGDLFHARSGFDAYWCDSKITIPDHGGISNESVLLTYSRFHSHYRSTFPGKVRNLGSTGAHLCYVAKGCAEGALLANLSYQDLAAAQIILTAAGGKIRKLNGQKFHLSDYLAGERIEEHLIAAPEGSHAAITMYIRELD